MILWICLLLLCFIILIGSLICRDFIQNWDLLFIVCMTSLICGGIIAFIIMVFSLIPNTNYISKEIKVPIVEYINTKDQIEYSSEYNKLMLNTIDKYNRELKRFKYLVKYKHVLPIRSRYLYIADWKIIDIKETGGVIK